jgi:Zn-dependent M28 family amino/carboxypeptidase
MRKLAPLLVLVLLAGCGGDGGGGEDRAGPDRFDAQRALRDLRAQVRIGPRAAGSAGSREEVAFIARQVRAAGLEARVQHPHRNVVARIHGQGPGTVVVGAHHDTKDIPGFVGAYDGASAVAVLLELARDLPRPLDGPSIDLVFFDAEEARGDRPFDVDGARGSGQFIRYAQRGGVEGSPPLSQIRAMVLFDMVGDCDLAVPREENSDPALYGMFADAAERQTGSPEPFVGTTAPILDDHGPFLAAGTPSVDLIDFTFGPGPSPGSWWHTREDDLERVCAASLDAVGEPALAALQAIG